MTAVTPRPEQMMFAILELRGFKGDKNERVACLLVADWIADHAKELLFKKFCESLPNEDPEFIKAGEPFNKLLEEYGLD